MHKHLLQFLILSFLISGCQTSIKITEISSQSIEFSSDNNSIEDSAISNLINPYKKKLELDMNASLASCEQNLTKARPEGLLGNLIADLTLWKSNEIARKLGIKNAEFCLLNHGGLRTSLPKGNIYKKRIFELMPFENELVILTLSGEKTKLLFDYLAYMNGMPISGASMGIKNGKAQDVKINGIYLDTNRTYRIATSDYLAFGGDNMSFFLKPLEFEKLNYKLRDGIIDYLLKENSEGRTINSILDKRIYIAE